MYHRTHFWAVAIVAVCSIWLAPAVTFAQQKDTPQKKEGIIIDEIMMMTTAAKGIEPLACCPYPRSRAENIAPGKSCRVDWKDGKTLGSDTLRLVRLEVIKGGVSVAQFTVSVKPQQKPMAMQCMKGFGCTGSWEAYPWKSAKGNYLEHTIHKFRLIPNTSSYFTIQNLDNRLPITVKVNPCE